ncbi:aquaporin [Mycoplasma phocimorsus]|uniref:aquaporin n=1 Tax=Mycoplasma phocimorsus TaxID=3045839 RepID=UPI0024BF72AD|nr:aquaporin [Mycoplasma phocimorsus]MDJ1647806.1 aquaporin [Mycoplasma phocimorsus]
MKINLFEYFKIGKRPDAVEPNSKLNWFKHLLSEFIGTIWLSFSLVILAVYVGSAEEAHGQVGTIINHAARVEDYLQNIPFVAMYAGFISVGIALFVFLRWSCDLNPAVTLYRWINGTNTTLYAFAKTVIQFIAAIITALIIYGLGSLTSPIDATNSTFDAIAATKKDFLVWNDNNAASGFALIFFGELLITLILLWPIFTKRISDKYRDLFIMVIIVFSVAIGIQIGTAAINPARGLAQQLPDLIFGIKNGSTAYASAKSVLGAGASHDALLEYASWELGFSTLFMFLGCYSAPIVYALLQGFTDKFVNPFVVRVIGWRNFKKDALISNKDRK